MFRYLVVGGVEAALDIALFSGLTQVLGLQWFGAAAFSFVVATLVNYFLSVRLVFTSGVRFSRHAEILWVFVVSGVGLVLNQTVLWILIERLAFHMVLAKVTATAAVFVWNYSLRRYFVFSAK